MGKSIKKIVEETSSDLLLILAVEKHWGIFIKLKLMGLHMKILHYWNIEFVQLYDPGVEYFKKFPTEKTDGVICTDVIEHIPTPDIELFIDQLYSLSKKFIFVVIATVAASKYFDDGRNIHLTVKKEEEWQLIFNNIKKVSKYNNSLDV